MISITEIQKIKKESKNKLNKKDELLAIVIPTKEDFFWQYSEVELFDPITREIIDRGSFLYFINEIITNPDYPLMRNYQPGKRKTA